MNAEKPQPVFCFPIPIWGHYYVAQFLRYCLPSLLASGNLPYLAGRGRVRVLITTTAEDQFELAGSPLMAELGRYAEVEFDVVEKPTGTTMSHCHNEGFARAGHGHVFFVLADHVLPERGMETLHRGLEKGFEAIQVIAPRIRHAAIRQALEPYRQGSVIAVPQQALNAISFPAIDDSTQWRDVDGPLFTNWPSILLQRSGGTVCVRFFHLHLLVLRNREGLRIGDDMTFDARFLGHAVPDRAKILTIDDCTEFFMPSTVPDMFLCPTESTHTDRPILNWKQSALVETADWARKHADALEWENFERHKICLSESREGEGDLLPETMVENIRSMARLLNYYEIADAATAERHNLAGLLAPQTRYLLVDAMVSKTMLPALSGTITPVSLDGIERLAGHDITLLAQMDVAAMPPGSVLVPMGGKGLVYLRKLLTLGLPVDAVFALAGEAPVIFPGVAEKPAGAGAAYLDAAGQNGKLVRIYDTADNDLRIGFVHGNQGIKLNTDGKIEFHHMGSKFAEINPQEGFVLTDK